MESRKCSSYTSSHYNDPQRTVLLLVIFSFKLDAMMQNELNRKSPLFETHVSLGARMVPFAGWQMPVQYSGILSEARAVRKGVGIFDVSHMGRVEFTGTDAQTLLDRVLSVNLTKLPEWRAKYNLICDLDGGIIDDCIIYRTGAQKFLLIPNASNTDAVLEWFSGWENGLDFEQINVTHETAMIAVQGPQSMSMMDSLIVEDLGNIKLFSCIQSKINQTDAFIARTGYTGEDGVEIVVPASEAQSIWQTLMDNGAEPCGLGARDVLRLDAGLPLHGNDMDTSVNPFEAGLERFVSLNNDDYVAAKILRDIRELGVSRSLVGFILHGKGIARHGYDIKDGSKSIGEVTSGSHSPTLDRSIGMGYVPLKYTPLGTKFDVDMRGRAVEAEVVPLPFYKREK